MIAEIILGTLCAVTCIMWYKMTQVLKNDNFKYTQSVEKLVRIQELDHMILQEEVSYQTAKITLNMFMTISSFTPGTEKLINALFKAQEVFGKKFQERKKKDEAEVPLTDYKGTVAKIHSRLLMIEEHKRNLIQIYSNGLTELAELKRKSMFIPSEAALSGSANQTGDVLDLSGTKKKKNFLN